MQPRGWEIERGRMCRGTRGTEVRRGRDGGFRERQERKGDAKCDEEVERGGATAARHTYTV